MVKLILIPRMTIDIVGCSQIPKEPAISFGKKCDVTEDGTLISSSVWIYSKAEGLKASEEAYNDPEFVKNSPHNSVVHKVDNSNITNPDQIAVTWRQYFKKRRT